MQAASTAATMRDCGTAARRRDTSRKKKSTNVGNCLVAMVNGTDAMIDDGEDDRIQRWVSSVQSSLFSCFIVLFRLI